MSRLRLIVIVGICSILALTGLGVGATEGPVLQQQSGFTPTPLPVVISTSTPLPSFSQPTADTLTIATPVPEDSTPEAPQDQVLLEVLNSANVRSEATTESDVLGTIEAGTSYRVIGRYFQWYQIRFDLSPTGAGWVYGEIATVTGDLSLVPDLSEENAATPVLVQPVDGTAAAQTATFEALLVLPGGVETATAQARIIEGPRAVVEGEENAAGLGGNPALPTFTPPPIGARATDVIVPTPEAAVLNITISDGVAPIVPIAVLGGLGMLGLLISFMRR